MEYKITEQGKEILVQGPEGTFKGTLPEVLRFLPLGIEEVGGYHALEVYEAQGKQRTYRGTQREILNLLAQDPRFQVNLKPTLIEKLKALRNSL